MRQTERNTKLPLSLLLFGMMVAVFAFGLHARIQLVRSGVSTTPSKISIQKRSSSEVVAETVVDDPPAPFPQHYAVTTAQVPMPAPDVLQSLQVESSLWKTSRLDSHGPSSRLRPPPFQL